MALHTRASSNCSVRRVCYLRRCRLSALPGGSHWLGRIEGGQRGGVKIFHRVKRGWIADGLGCLGANGGGMIYSSEICYIYIYDIFFRVGKEIYIYCSIGINISMSNVSRSVSISSSCK